MKRIIIVLVLLVFLLSGCRGSSRDLEGDVNYRRGTSGLEMRFLDRSPPYVIYERDYLPITLELYNKGASSIRRGEIHLRGFDTSIITVYGPNGVLGNLAPQYFEMEDRKTQFNREGGYKIMEFNSGQIILPPGTDKYRIPLTVIACYDYETIANSEICIDPQPHVTTLDKPCITRNVAMGGGQGAPVAVTNVEVTNMRNKVSLTFNIQNVGGGFGSGEPVDLVKLDQGACPHGFGINDIDVVYLTMVRVGLDQVTDCSPSGRIRLVNGRGRVTCTHNIGGETAYMTPLEIRLEYGYRSSIRRDVEIRGYY